MRYLLPNLVLDDRLMQSASNRFAEAFRLTWARIPGEDRRLISEFLVKRPGSVHLCFAMDFGAHADEPWGRCSLWGTDKVVFTFLAPFVERADPLEAVSAVIAHELAHCYNHANGTWTGDDEVEERNTREITARWGFGEDPSYGNNPEWKQAVDRWREHRLLEFGAATERRLLGEC
jgi:hypothetical protein